MRATHYLGWHFGLPLGARSRAAGLLLLGAALAAPLHGRAATYYVRQTVGDDSRDGLAPDRAWRHVRKLSSAMRAGDTAYVGPGLYRDEVTPIAEGTRQARMTFIADPTGRHTGDPPGAVLVTGAEPADETIFTPAGPPGVYTAPIPWIVWGVVEMDGPQYRYARAVVTEEHLVAKLPPLEVVAKRPASYHYDEAAKVLHFHTSDGQPPTAHEIELMQRGAGFHLVGKHHVTIAGFTFRHTQDAGINVFKGSGDVVVAGNTVWGCRQGVRVYGATNVLVHGNTLFRNENSGVYFALASVHGRALDNVAYENVKGLRWSSDSKDGQARDNVSFDNHERGLSVESTGPVLLRRNVLVNNTVSQLQLLQARVDSDANCFANGSPEQLAVDMSPYTFADRFRILADYQRATGQDLRSHDGRCGALPAKVDVRKLHAETTGYAERARRILSGAEPAPPDRGLGGGRRPPGAG